MDFELSEEQRAVQQMVREFAEREIAPVAAELDEREAFPAEIIRKLSELGLMGILFPKAYGGAGMRCHGARAVAHSMLCGASLSLNHHE